MKDEVSRRYGDELVVSTPEMVSFDYQLAGIGSRILAQLIDFPIQLLLLLVAVLGGIAAGTLVGNSGLAVLATIVAGLLLAWGYPILSESVWSGQTLGKRVFGLRVVGDQGEPIRISQSFIRNLVRIIDFLPGLYGLGLTVLFLNGHGKRLGDLAAGTVVVRERATVKLHQLAPPPPPPGLPAQVLPAPMENLLLRSLDVDLRRFLESYALRRLYLDPWRRQVLAAAVAPALARALPEMVATRGASAALEHLADLMLAGPAGA